jgi:hypothetical protein
MYDFHLAGMLPVAFINRDAGIFRRIFDLASNYAISPDSIRFSLAESHDGKSVRGSADLLTLAERQALADTVENNGGRVKYKGVPPREVPVSELEAVCREAGLDFKAVRSRAFKPGVPETGILSLADDIQDAAGMAAALGISQERLSAAGPLKFFYNKILEGREPYELCVATRDCLPALENPALAAERYLCFYTLAFALMGRNVKSIYFNDLLGLPNDDARVKETGELRDIKRSKSQLFDLEKRMADPGSFEHRVAAGMNNLIALADADPALHPRGNEAAVPGIAGQPDAVAVVHCSGTGHTLVVVNIAPDRETLTLRPAAFGFTPGRPLCDNFEGSVFKPGSNGDLTLKVGPFERFWLTEKPVEIASELLIAS